jgi:hypothetical protein
MTDSSVSGEAIMSDIPRSIMPTSRQASATSVAPIPVIAESDGWDDLLERVVFRVKVELAREVMVRRLSVRRGEF